MTTKPRPSPTAHAADHKNKVLTGNDGNRYRSEPDKNGVYRWKKVTATKRASAKATGKSATKRAARKPTTKRAAKTAARKKPASGKSPPKRPRAAKLSRSYVERGALAKPRTYLMHDNGSRPFKVTVSSKRVDVFMKPRNSEEGAEHSVLVLTIPGFQGYWWGKDTTSYGLHHNSLLIKENDTDYVHIGREIYQFSPGEAIVDYLSPMGNSDVPYPVAYGEERVYFMLEKLSLLKTEMDMPATPELAPDVSGEIYKHEDRAKPFKRLRQLKKRLSG